MFEHFFGLTENPFNLTPDPRFIFLSEVHQEALSHLRYGIEKRKGFVLITGEVGAGKTTVCRTLLAELQGNIRTAMILNPSLSDIELLQTICQEFGLDASQDSKKALLDSLYNFLIEGFEKGENAVLIIDECQNLSPGVLEQIRMLSNLETEKEKLLQIILIGQPELVNILSAQSLRQINDRIVLRYHMWPLDYDDTRDYIYHRLVMSGSHGRINFSTKAIRDIYSYSQGVPRKINAVAERSLLIAYLRSKTRITGPIVHAAIKELQGNYDRPRNISRVYLPAAAIICFVMFLAAFLLPAISDISASLRSGNRGAVQKQDIKPRMVDAIIADEKEDLIQAIIPSPEPPIDYQDEWVIGDYQEALDVLAQVPDGLNGPDMLNLHPDPRLLDEIRIPAVVSIEDGYAVLINAGEGYVRLVGKDNAFVEMTGEDFRQIYRWNMMITYVKTSEDEVYSMHDTGSEIEMIQSVLKRFRYIPIQPDGEYGIDTVKGVERLQEAFGLRIDGIVGPETLTLIRLLDRGKG